MSADLVRRLRAFRRFVIPRFESESEEQEFLAFRKRGLVPTLVLTNVGQVFVIVLLWAIGPDYDLTTFYGGRFAGTQWLLFSTSEKLKWTFFAGIMFTHTALTACVPWVHRRFDDVLLGIIVLYSLCIMSTFEHWAALVMRDGDDTWPAEARLLFRHMYEETLLIPLGIAGIAVSSFLSLGTAHMIAGIHVMQLSVMATQTFGFWPDRKHADGEGWSFFERIMPPAFLYVINAFICLSTRRSDVLLHFAFRQQSQLQAEAASLETMLSRERTDRKRLELEASRRSAEEGSDLCAASLGEEELRAVAAALETAALPASLPRVPPDAVLLRERLGSGSYGEVLRAEWQGTPVAAKRLRRDRLDAAALRSYYGELKLMHTLGEAHNNLLGALAGVWSEPPAECPMLLCELCARGTLQQLLFSEETGPTLAWRAIKLPIAQGIADAMAFLHAQSPPVIHRDLKPENIFIDDGYNAKVGDFGSSRAATDEETMTVAGTPLFQAPEQLRLERYDHKVDVWAFGCTLETLWTHTLPFAAHRAAEAPHDASLLHRIAEGGVVPSVPPDSFLAPVLAPCAALDPDERPEFAELAAQLRRPELLAASPLRPGPGGGKLRISIQASVEELPVEDSMAAPCTPVFVEVEGSRSRKTPRPPTPTRGKRAQRANANKFSSWFVSEMNDGVYSLVGSEVLVVQHEAPAAAAGLKPDEGRVDEDAADLKV